jgi:hypothetical protein
MSPLRQIATCARIASGARNVRRLDPAHGAPQGRRSCISERLGIVDTLVDALILALTLGGALQWLSDLWQRVFALESLWHGAALVLSVLLIKGALGLPLSLYRIFVIEERFGFNRMTWKLSSSIGEPCGRRGLGVPCRCRAGCCRHGLLWCPPVLVAYSRFCR